MDNIFWTKLFIYPYFFGSNTFWHKVFGLGLFFHQQFFRPKFFWQKTTTTTSTLLGFDTIEINLVDQNLCVANGLVWFTKSKNNFVFNSGRFAPFFKPIFAFGGVIIRPLKSTIFLDYVRNPSGTWYLTYSILIFNDYP